MIKNNYDNQKKEENKHRMKEGAKEFAIHDKDGSKYSVKLLIQLSERKKQLKLITMHNDIVLLDSYRYQFTCLIY